MQAIETEIFKIRRCGVVENYDATFGWPAVDSDVWSRETTSASKIAASIVGVREYTESLSRVV